MCAKSLADLLESKSPVELLREQEGAKAFPIPDEAYPQVREYTNWIDEQRSWRETCGISDFSHHMVGLNVQGPDTIELHSDYCVNSFEGFEEGQAKQIVACNPDGHLIGDAVLFHLGGDEVVSIGVPTVANWLQYNIETGDYDVTYERQGRTHEVEGTPHYFRYHMMGPKTDEIVNEVTEDPLPDIPFFNFKEVTINGHDVHAFRHTMTGKGLEIFGPYEHGPEIFDLLMDAGEEYGIRKLGIRGAFGNISVVSGWYPLPVPAVYDHQDLKGYREWLDADSLEANLPLGGSFVSDDITDYYVTPVEIGYNPTIAFDHDYVGREALEDEVEDPDRTAVTLVWDPEDVVDIFMSLFGEGPMYKFLDLPFTPWDSAHYDRVLKDGELVGLSQWYSYTVNERAMLSQASIDVEHAEPGTEVTVIWGEEDSPKSNVESGHVEKEINATVAPVPYSDDNRDIDERRETAMAQD